MSRFVRKRHYSRMARIKGITKFVIAVVVLVIGVVILVCVETRRRPGIGGIVSLPNGSFIRLTSATYGTNFSFSIPRPKPWQQALLRHLPSSFASRFGWWMGSGGSISLGNSPGATNLAILTASERPSRSKTQLALLVFDEQGDLSLPEFGGSTVGNDDGKRFRSFRCWQISAFPRREKMLGLRFVEIGPNTNSWKTVAEFQIRNPVFAKYPVWEPEPLPATRTNGELSVTLMKFATGLKVNEPQLKAEFGELSGTRATFLAKSAGHPEQVWRPRSIEMSDATGNKWAQYPPLTFAKEAGDAEEFTFAGALWRGEAAWKLRAEFMRVAGFEPGETWRTTEIPIPTSNQVILLSESGRIGKTKLSLKAITGAGAKQPGDMEWLAVDGMVNISIHATPWEKEKCLSLIQAVDDHGQEVEVHSGADWKTGDMAFGLVIPRGAKTLVCTFALHETRFVEFQAVPEFSGNGAPAPP